MQQFNPSPQWQERNITPLQHPIAEFNAREGLDLGIYQAIDQHITEAHPTEGREQWARIEQELPPLETLEDPATGQHLRVRRFNWPEPNTTELGTVTVFNDMFSVPIDMKHGSYQHKLLADALDSPLIVFENPGFGESDDLTPDQKTALRKYGDFRPIAEPMLRILNNLGVKEINCVGYSMGAETAAAMAALAKKYGITVRHLFVMEAPRVEKRNPVKLGLIDFPKETKNLKFAWRHPIDPVMREIAKLEVGLPKGATTYGLAMAKGGLERDLKDALKSQPYLRLTIGSAGKSKISASKANNGIYNRLHRAFPDRTRRIIMPGESHAYGDSGKRYANLAKLALR